ncbi:MAG: type IV secretion system protein [Formosimonas sp.]
MALTLMTLWIIFQGYALVTGRSQEGAKGFVFNAMKSYVIIMVATGVAATSSFSVRALTDKTTDLVAEVMTGNSDMAKCLRANGAFLGCKVDRNLQVMQVAMNVVGQIDTANDPVLEDKKARAAWFTGIGSAGPALVTGTMILMYKVMMALFVGFGPLFIMSLLFKRTAHLFQKWLFYGLSTIFSMMLLAVMSDIAMDLVMNLATGLFVSSTLLGANTSGVMAAATQQLGLGLLLSTLLITVPPMAGSFFSAMLGSFSHQGAFSGNSMGAMPAAPQGKGLGEIGTGFAGAGSNNTTGPASNTPAPPSAIANQHASRVSNGQSTNTSSDVTRTAAQSQRGAASNAVIADKALAGQGMGQFSADAVKPVTVGSAAPAPASAGNSPAPAPAPSAVAAHQTTTGANTSNTGSATTLSASGATGSGSALPNQALSSSTASQPTDVFKNRS